MRRPGAARQREQLMTEIKDVTVRVPGDSPRPSRAKATWYWITTGIVVLTLFGSSLEDFGRVQAVRDEVAAIGLPVYLLTILAVWKVLGTIALLAPRRPLIKEWAYAGTFFLFTGGLACNLIKNVGYNDIILLFVLIPVTIASWLLRPSSRRLPRTERRYPVGPGTELA
jgi:uncharacterized membrane protein YphA (DoxX/SURF4 family)